MSNFGINAKGPTLQEILIHVRLVNLKLLLSQKAYMARFNDDEFIELVFDWINFLGIQRIMILLSNRRFVTLLTAQFSESAILFIDVVGQNDFVRISKASEAYASSQKNPFSMLSAKVKRSITSLLSLLVLFIYLLAN